MKIQIIVENNVLDLSNDLETNITYAIDDVSKFSARNTSFSKTIVIPGTAQNNFVFGNIFDISISNAYNSGNANVGFNYNAAKSAQCLIYCDNIQIIKGVIRILEVTIVNGIVEYECAVFGELGGLVSAIGDRLLEALDFSADNHNLNATNIQNSWTAAGTYNYYYPFIDYGDAWTTDGINFDAGFLRPAIYAKSYIDKIFTAAGYTYSSAFLNSASFTNLVIPNNNDGNYLDVTNLYWRTYTGSANTVTTSPYTLTYNTSTGTQYLTEASGSVTYARTTPNPVSFNVYGDALVNAQNSTGGALQFTLRVYKNGSTDTGIGTTVTVNAGTLYSGTVTVSGTVTLNTGDTLKLVITSATIGSFSPFLYIAGTFKGFSSSSLKINVAYGDQMLMNGHIPKGIKQIDFLTSILNMFNLYITEDKNVDKQLNIIPYKDFYDLNPVNAKDWTNKIDRSKPIKLKPLGEMSSKAFKFTYKDDVKDYYSDTYKRKYGQVYGTIVYDTGLEMAEGTTEVQPLFIGTPLVQVNGNNIIAPAIYSKDNSGTKKSLATPPRILYRSPATIPVTTSINLKNGATTVAASLSAYPYIGHLDTPVSPALDLNFGAPAEIYASITGTYPSANLFNTYWSGYIAEITNKDSKLLTAYFKLGVMDILNLDFSKLIFIEGQLFRLNKITDYNALEEEVTKCELVNVINLL
jgi:hypothetical protein